MIPLHDINPARRPALVVRSLVVLNVAAFLLELLLGPTQVVAKMGFVPALFFQDPLGEGYRILTSMFLHGGLFHLLSNMWFLWVFGDNVEDRMGGERFLLFYLLGGVAAALAQALFMPASTVPMIGASGAVSAVLGAYYVLFPRAYVITLVWFVLPFTLALPYANHFWTVVLSIPIGFILASAFSAMLVYAQELMPGRVGMISGLFFGLAFGIAAIGAAILGVMADHWGIVAVYQICAVLPLLGLAAFLLPDTRH